MSNIKLTPGTWRVVDRVTNGVKGYEICWSDDGESVTDHVYEEADAYVIAAAKDLYRALKAVLAIVDDSSGVSGYNLSGNLAEWGDFEEVGIAVDAIAKAEGNHD